MSDINTRKEALAEQKELIKLETVKIRTLKERNRVLSRNHSLGWKETYELNELRAINSFRHYWYFRLKNMYTVKYGQTIMSELNSNYPHNTAVFLNEIGATEYFIKQLNMLGSK